MKVLGIFGPPGAGKSKVLEIFESLGVSGIDADSLVHDLYRAGEKGSEAISRYFGTEYLNIFGDVDRKKLGQLIASSPEKLVDLNRLIHPFVDEEIRRRLSVLENRPLVAVESVHFGNFVDYFLKVEAPRDVCFQRSGMDRALFEILHEVQPRYRVDFIIQNIDSVEHLRLQVEKVKDAILP